MAFCHAEAVFNAEWLEKNITLGNKLSHVNTPFKIGAFSVYNPNEYRLISTVYQNEEYTIKSSFSFLTVFFYQVFLQKICHTDSY